MGVSTKIAVAALCVAFLAMVASQVNTMSQSQKNCQRIERLKSYAYATIQRSKITLPDTAYYKTHPKELKAALERNNEAAQAFSPKECPFIQFGG